jgi:hypothetical protein
MAVTLCAAFSFLLVDNLVNQFFATVVSKFSFSYYTFAYTTFNAQPLEGWMIPRGLILNLLTGLFFYLLAYRRIHRMQF